MVSRIALGTAQFGLRYGIANESGQISMQEAKSILQLAKKARIDLIDTAMAYGSSESILGNVGVGEFRIVTKIALESTDSDAVEDLVFSQVELSLQKLKVSRLYAILLHRPNQLLSPKGEAIYRALQTLKDSGVIEKIGISIYSPNELEDILPRYQIDIVQAPFNIFDQRLYLSGWMDDLKKRNIEIHARSIFLQGLLLMPKNMLPTKFYKWEHELTKWGNWLENNNFSAIQACLIFALSFQKIDKVIVGVDSLRQLMQIVDSLENQPLIAFPDFHLNDEDLINPMNWSAL